MTHPPLTLTLPRIPVTANQLARCGRLSKPWWKRAREKKAWTAALQQECAATFGRLRGPVAAPQRCQVRIRVWRPVRQDPDNRFASLKPVLDSLRAVGLIYQDSPKWLELEAEDFPLSESLFRRPKTEISIRYVEEFEKVEVNP